MRPSRISAALVACATLGSTAIAADRTPDWLIGCWEGEPNTAAEQRFEAWAAPRGGRMLGLGHALRGTGSIFEYMRIDSGERGLRFVPQPGGRPPVEFTAERVEPQRILFANPQHEYPKYIDYRREADRLEVRLSAVPPEQDGRRALFAFRRVACDTLFAAR